MIVAVTLSGQRLSASLRELTTSQLGREARLVAVQWQSDVPPDALADSAGTALRQRVTLVDSSGVVLGDSEFSGAALAALQNHNTRPEIMEARLSGTGSSRRISPSEGDEELYVAVAAPDGRISRVSNTTAQPDGMGAGAGRP